MVQDDATRINVEREYGRPALRSSALGVSVDALAVGGGLYRAVGVEVIPTEGALSQSVAAGGRSTVGE